MTNTPGYNHYRIQLKDMVTNQSIIATGAAGAGVVFVAKAGTPAKETLTDKYGTSLANPLALVRGLMDFCVATTEQTVDLYIQTPGGHFVVLKGIGPSGLNEYPVDTTIKRVTMTIPYNFADCGGAAVETATGFIVPDPSFFLDSFHAMGINVTAVSDASKTINVGTAEASSAGGDSDTFMAAVSTATVGLVDGTDGTAFSSNAPATSTSLKAGNSNIVYVLSSGTTKGGGFIFLPLQLA